MEEFESAIVVSFPLPKVGVFVSVFRSRTWVIYKVKSW